MNNNNVSSEDIQFLKGCGILAPKTWIAEPGHDWADQLTAPSANVRFDELAQAWLLFDRLMRKDRREP